MTVVTLLKVTTNVLKKTFSQPLKTPRKLLRESLEMKSIFSSVRDLV